jgi:hypothetical protein
VFVDPAYTINQPLYRAEDFVQNNPLSGKYPGHINPEWLSYGKQNQKVYSDLQKSIQRHFIFSLKDNSEFLRLKKGIRQINKQHQTNDPTNEVFPIHSIPPHSRSQARTYQNDTPKKTKINTIKMESTITITSELLIQKKSQGEIP